MSDRFLPNCSIPKNRKRMVAMTLTIPYTPEANSVEFVPPIPMDKNTCGA